MKLIKETFLNLQPVEKIKRTPITGHSGLYLEQNISGYTFQLKYKSPVSDKYRFMKLLRFKYGDNVNKKMLDNILKQLVINQGIVAGGSDPIEKKKADKPKPKKKITTVNEVFNSFIETHHFNQMAESTQLLHLGAYKNHIYKKFGTVDISKISRPDIVLFLDPIKKDGIYNSSVLCLQRIEQHAYDTGKIKTNFMFKIKKRATVINKNYLSEKNIIALLTSTIGWDSLRNICKMQLLTGCRNGEVSGMRWEEIDLKNKTWTIPPERIKTERKSKKMDRPHVLPIMSKMSEILLQQRQHGTAGLVFKKIYSYTSRVEYYQPGAAGRWLKDSLQITGGTHQLRHTVATNLANMPDMSELDIKIVLNHAVGGETSTYIHTQYLERKRKILTKWHNYIDSLMTTGVQNHG